MTNQTPLQTIAKRGKINEFNAAAVKADLNRFSVETAPTGAIITRIDGQGVTAKYTPKSQNYQVLDFAKVGAGFIDQVGAHLDIKHAKVDLYGGVQELRLYGDDVEINGDKYSNMACLMSSTDGTRTLRVAYGLIRWICSNGMVSMQTGEHFKVRHLKSNEKVLQALDMNFGAIDSTFDKIMNTIAPLANKEIQLSTIRDSIVEDKMKNAPKYLKFVGKLLNSKTDRLQNLTKQQVKALTSGEALLTTNRDFDMALNAYQAFQCYTEIFRSQDLGEIQKETDRILAIVG